MLKLKQLLTNLNPTQKLIGLGLGGVIFLYVSAAGIYSAATPWGIIGGDTIAHVDFIYRIYHGDLPRTYEGVTYKPFEEMGGDNIYQRAVGHPPLFHIIHAPFVGPLLESGQWEKAIAVGRGINMAMSVVLIGILAWAGWLFGGKRKAQFAVAVPALSVMTYRYLRLNKDYALDGLLAIWTTLTIIVLHKIIQDGINKKNVAALTLISVAGTATKASYIVFLLISLGVVAIVTMVREKKLSLTEFIKGGILAGAIGAAAVVAIGWYYYLWNFKESHSFFTPLPPTFTGGREAQSFVAIILGEQFWGIFYARYAAFAAVSTIITSFAAAGLLHIKKSKFLQALKDRKSLLIILVMLTATAATVAMQLKLAYPRGSLNYRYMLPVILPIGLFYAAGLLEFRQLRGQLVALASFALAGTTILSLKIAPSGDGFLPGVHHWPVAIKKIYKLTQANSVPDTAVTLMFLMLIAGAAMLCVSLFKLSKQEA